jgi:hypothetical protein
MEEIQKSIWDKTTEELTVKEQYKLALGGVAITTAISVGVWAGVYGAAVWWQKRQERKNRQDDEGR